MATTVRNLALRLDKKQAARLDAFESTTGVEGTTLARNALDAALKHFETYGSISFPMTIVPTSSLQESFSETAKKMALSTAAVLTDSPESYTSGKSRKAI